MKRTLTMIDLPKNAQRGRQRFFARVNKSFDGAAQEIRNDANINIYDEISPWGITALDVRAALDKIDASNINVNIHSPGGDVFAGIAIHNDLRSHPATINVKVTGLAASAASLIAMAGDTIEMADNSFMMIHNAWALAIGDRNEFEKMVETLGAIDATLARTYASRAGQDVADVAEFMDAETWFSAEQAVERGFADTIAEDAQVDALFDLSAFNGVPAALKRNIENGLRDAGYSRRQSVAAIATGFHALSMRVTVNREPSDSDIDETATAMLALIHDLAAQPSNQLINQAGR